MEAKKLTVAYPTVQHTVDVDVVGLWEREKFKCEKEDFKGLTMCLGNEHQKFASIWHENASIKDSDTV